jgi:hypothetical protein
MPIHLKASDRNCRRFAVVVLGMLLTAAAPAKDGQQGLRFDSAGVLDLAERTQKVAGDPVALSALDVNESGKIIAAQTLSEDQATLAFSADVYACKSSSKDCSQEHERKLIDAAAGAVKRDGKHLSVTPTSGTPALFVDWNVPVSKTADGDAETHWYLGRLDGSGYYRVEVQFGHDAPGNFLINPANGKTAFVHNGSDVVAPSPDGLQLVTLNTLNSPLSLRIAALDSAGPRLVLQCETSNENEHVAVQFKGWHDARSFDVVLEIHPDNNKLARRIALRMTQGSAGWSLSTSDHVPLIAMGFGCRESAPDGP